MKAKHANEVKTFTDIPNVGPAMERDFALLGLKTPSDLIDKDPYKLYQNLSKLSGRQDPCVLDTYMAVIDFMNGAKVRPWFSYTAHRKQQYPKI